MADKKYTVIVVKSVEIEIEAESAAQAEALVRDTLDDADFRNAYVSYEVQRGWVSDG